MPGTFRHGTSRSRIGQEVALDAFRGHGDDPVRMAKADEVENASAALLLYPSECSGLSRNARTVHRPGRSPEKANEADGTYSQQATDSGCTYSGPTIRRSLSSVYLGCPLLGMSRSFMACVDLRGT